MKKKLLVVAGILAVLLVAALLVLPLLVDVDGYRPSIERAISASTGRSVELGRLSFGLIPSPALRASGVTIGEDPAFGAEPFLTAGDLSVEVSLLPLLSGRLEIGAVTIASPEVTVMRSKEGWNLTSLMTGEAGVPVEGGAAPPAAPGKGKAGKGAAAAGEKATASHPITIREVRLSGGKVRFRDRSVRPGKIVTIAADDIDLVMTDLSTTSPVGFRLSMALKGSGTIEAEGTIGPFASSAGSAGLPMDAHVGLAAIKGAAVAPWIEALSGLKVSDGTLSLDLTMKGAPPDRLAVSGSVDLEGLKMEPVGSGGAPISMSASLGLDAGIDGAATRLSRGDLVISGTRLSVTGSVTQREGRSVLEARIRADKATVAGLLPIVAIFGPFVPDGVGSAGTVSVDATLSGPTDHPADLALGGSASLDGVEFTTASLTRPLRAISGTVKLGKERISVEGFSASLGRSSLQGSCRISGFAAPVIDVDLKAPLLDIDELLSMLAGPATEGQAVAVGRRAPREPLLAGFAAAPPAEGAGADGGSTIAAGSSNAAGAAGAAGDAADALVASARASTAPAAAFLDRLTLTGKVAATEAKLLNLKLAGFQAHLDMAGGRARIGEASLSLYGGGFTGELTTSVSESGPPFTLDATLKGVDFDALVTDFAPDMAGLLHGTLDAGLQLTGRGLARPQLRRELTGDASFSMVDGRLTSVGVLKDLASALESAGGKGIGQEETPFSYLGATFRVKGGKARTEDLKLDSPDISLRGDGRVTMDLGLELDLKARIAPEVTASMVAKREDLRFLTDDKGRIRIDLQVGGSLVEPAVKVDPDMIRRVLKSAAREKLSGKVLGDLFKKKP